MATGTGYPGMSFVAATLLVHTAAVAQLRGFTRESLSQMPLSQLTKVAAAEGIEPAHLEVILALPNTIYPFLTQHRSPVYRRVLLRLSS